MLCVIRVYGYSSSPGHAFCNGKNYSVVVGRCFVDVVCSGEGEGQHEGDEASGTAVMMSTCATANGDVGVAYANTAFRNLGLLEFQLADLEGVVVQVIVL